MENFIKKHATLPSKFIKDFFFITEKAYIETDIAIVFEQISYVSFILLFLN